MEFMRRLINTCLNGTYGKVRVVGSLIQNGLKQGNVLSQLVFTRASDASLYWFIKTRYVLELNGLCYKDSHWFLRMCEKFQISGNNSINSKLYSRRN